MYAPLGTLVVMSGILPAVMWVVAGMSDRMVYAANRIERLYVAVHNSGRFLRHWMRKRFAELAEFCLTSPLARLRAQPRDNRVVGPRGRKLSRQWTPREDPYAIKRKAVALSRRVRLLGGSETLRLGRFGQAESRRKT